VEELSFWIAVTDVRKLVYEVFKTNPYIHNGNKDNKVNMA
jgi:hypothetical protein